MMYWIYLSWSWIIEPMVLIIILKLLINTVRSSSKKIEIFTQQMCASTLKAQTFLQYVDHEFDVMNNCAKSVKNIFLNFDQVYKDIKEGTKTVDEATKEAKIMLPEELQQNLSKILGLSVHGSQSSLCNSVLEVSPKKNLLVDLELKKPNELFGDKNPQPTNKQPTQDKNLESSTEEVESLPNFDDVFRNFSRRDCEVTT